jgi:hypothetical protein
MMNARNELGTWGLRSHKRVAVGIALAIAALALLVGQARAQDIAQPFDLRGTVVDAENGAPLVGAWVSLTGSEWGSISDDAGRFRIPDLYEGPVSLTVEQLGYETLEWSGEVTSASSPLALRVRPQPVLLEGLQVVTDRFRSRRNAVATSVRSFDASDLTTSPQRTALEFVSQRALFGVVPCRGRWSTTCVRARGRVVEPTVYVDEAPIVAGLDYLDSMAPWELYMIEVYAGGRHIRAYTPQFMERAAKQRLNPIALFF